MDINEVIREYDNLRHQAERLVAEYFGVSGYKVANVNIEDDMLLISYYDISCPNTIKVPKAWLDLSDEELTIANKEFALKKHEEYMAEQENIFAKQKAAKEAQDKALYEELKERFG